MIDVLSLTPAAAREAIAAWLATNHEPASRGRQILPRLWPARGLLGQRHRSPLAAPGSAAP
jgi:hypothetical protein